jgi:hypothetical protein
MDPLTPANFLLVFQVFIKVLVIWSPVIVGTGLYMYFTRPKKRTTRHNKGKKIMRAGEVYEWLDQGPAVLLAPCTIADPIPVEKKTEFLQDPEGFLHAWPSEQGWTIKLLMNGDIIDVHEETLDAAI